MRSGLIDAGHDVGAGVELYVDDADPILGSPANRIFEAQVATDVDADAIERNVRHGCFPGRPLYAGTLRGMRRKAQILSGRGGDNRKRRSGAASLQETKRPSNPV